MPIEATPREHVPLVAVATKLTGDPTVAPLLGLLTVTPANAEVAKAVIRQICTQSLFMAAYFSSFYDLLTAKRALNDLRFTQILLTWFGDGKHKTLFGKSKVHDPGQNQRHTSVH